MSFMTPIVIMESVNLVGDALHFLCYVCISPSLNLGILKGWGVRTNAWIKNSL